MLAPCAPALLLLLLEEAVTVIPPPLVEAQALPLLPIPDRSLLLPVLLPPAKLLPRLIAAPSPPLPCHNVLKLASTRLPPRSAVALLTMSASASPTLRLRFLKSLFPVLLPLALVPLSPPLLLAPVPSVPAQLLLLVAVAAVVAPAVVVVVAPVVSPLLLARLLLPAAAAPVVPPVRLPRLLIAVPSLHQPCPSVLRPASTRLLPRLDAVLQTMPASASPMLKPRCLRRLCLALLPPAHLLLLKL